MMGDSSDCRQAQGERPQTPVWLMDRAGAAGWVAGLGSLPAGVMEGFQGSEVPPGWGKAILQKLPAALAWGLEQLYVASQPGLKRRQSGEKGLGTSSTALPVGRVVQGQGFGRF